MSLPPVYLIAYDDRDRPFEIITDEAAARTKFGRISGQWNAHLFVKIESNSRDDPYFMNNAVLAREARDVEISRLIVEIRAAKSLAWRDSLFEQVVEVWEASTVYAALIAPRQPKN